MTDGRIKGAAFEREIVNKLKEFCDQHNANIHISRNFEQRYKPGECDINFLNYAIECKRYANGFNYKPAWWEQVCEAAGDTRIPTLIFKYNRLPIQVALPFWAILKNETKNNNKVFVVSWENFIDIIKENTIFQAYVNEH